MQVHLTEERKVAISESKNPESMAPLLPYNANGWSESQPNGGQYRRLR